jgi:hypothetical protein
MWAQEDIPGEAAVFMRLHRMWIRDGLVVPGAFQDRGAGMSVDWDKYSTPDETRQRARRPSENAVISMEVISIRAIQGLVVVHEPIQENTFDSQGNPLASNRSHSNVIGEKDTERRLKLSRIYSWEIPV